METKIKIETMRFVYSDEFTKEIEYFSKIHQYDDRRIFKEEWKKWIEEENIKKRIESEIEHIQSNGYKGDIMDKMYKSARYYYRKKNKTEEEVAIQKNNEDNDEFQKNADGYSGLSKEMIKHMDSHILEMIYKNTEKTNSETMISKVKASSAFDDFCQNYINEITDEIYRLKEKIKLNPVETSTKFKKAYKNRFYKTRLSLDA
jgi:hypothetical protein